MLRALVLSKSGSYRSAFTSSSLKWLPSQHRVLEQCNLTANELRVPQGIHNQELPSSPWFHTAPAAMSCSLCGVLCWDQHRAGAQGEWGPGAGDAACCCFYIKTERLYSDSLSYSSLTEEGLTPGFRRWLISIQLRLHIRFLSPFEWSPLGGNLSYRVSPLLWGGKGWKEVGWPEKARATVPLPPAFRRKKGHLRENISWCACSGWAQPNPSHVGCRKAG